MSTREDLEAWAGSVGYQLSKTELNSSGFAYGETVAAWAVWQAATSRQEAKIKALRDSLTWALSNISEEHYGWPSDEDAAAHNAAIAAAKE